MSAGKYPATRFDPDNVWSACCRCNLFLYGNLQEYRKRLVQKLGLDRVEELEQRAKGIHKHERSHLIEIIRRYSKT